MTEVFAALAPLFKALLEALFAEWTKPETGERAQYDETDRYIDDAIDADVYGQGL